jgi:hypothetical protein
LVFLPRWHHAHRLSLDERIRRIRHYGRIGGESSDDLNRVSEIAADCHCFQGDSIAVLHYWYAQPVPAKD